jgi:hypothetical protein
MGSFKFGFIFVSRNGSWPNIRVHMDKLKRAQTNLFNLAHKSEFVRCINNRKI